MDKNSFVMYTTYAEHINLLTMEQRGLLLTAIMNYASGEPLPDMVQTGICLHRKVWS